MGAAHASPRNGARHQAPGNRAPAPKPHRLPRRRRQTNGPSPGNRGTPLRTRGPDGRSEEHTSELQSLRHLVVRVHYVHGALPIYQRRNLIAFPGAGGRRMDPVQETAERRCELAGLMVWRLIGHGLDLQLRWPLPAARDTQPSVSIGPPRDIESYIERPKAPEGPGRSPGILVVPSLSVTLSSRL